jgi:hypothetical protein
MDTKTISLVAALSVLPFAAIGCQPKQAEAPPPSAEEQTFAMEQAERARDIKAQEDREKLIENISAIAKGVLSNQGVTTAGAKVVNTLFAGPMATVDKKLREAESRYAVAIAENKKDAAAYYAAERDGLKKEFDDLKDKGERIKEEGF